MAKNTLENGLVRCIIFKQGDTWYGVGLEFNIVEQGDDPLSVFASLQQALSGYVETARKYKMRPLSLNQQTDKEYEAMWQALEQRKRVVGKQVYHFGYYPGAFRRDFVSV